MRSLDHLTLAWVGERGGLTAAEKELVKACAMVLAASWSWLSMTFCPPIMIRLPFAVHLTAEMQTC